MAPQPKTKYPIDIISIAVPVPESTGFCPLCLVELEREFQRGQFILFCTSCDFSESEF